VFALACEAFIVGTWIQGAGSLGRMTSATGTGRGPVESRPVGRETELPPKEADLSDEASVPWPVYSDSEIRSVKEDSLGRTAFATRVAERIIKAGSGPSTVFGLSGPWGTGKTSTLNMIADLIETASNDPHSEAGPWSVSSFTPWSCADLDALTDEFYLAIAAAMPETSQGEKAKSLLARATPFAKAVGKAAVSSIVDKYIGDDGLKKIIEAGADSLTDDAAKIAIEQPPFNERFKMIAKSIEDSGHRILVIIDDVDRLHADELLSVMKAVRLLGRFNHVHYLISYDESTVLDVLTGTDIAGANRERARRYLEKMIQFPFTLPPIQVQQLELRLRAQLEIVAELHGLLLEDDVELRNKTVDRILAGVPNIRSLTLRSIYRWCNQIEVLVALVGAYDIDFADAALATYLRVFHNDVYVRVPEWRSDLVASQAGFIAMYPSEKTVSREEWQKRVSDTLGNDDKNAAGAADALSVLGSLFNGVNGGRYFAAERFSIQHSDYFDRYFALGIPVDDVSDLRVREDLKFLARNGVFASGSIIRDSINSKSSGYGVARKAFAEVNVIKGASASSAFDAARQLMNACKGLDRIYTPTGAVIYCLLGQAVLSVLDPKAAASLIDKFEFEFGLEAGANILRPRDAVETVYDHAVLSASGNFRQKVVAACVTDLTTEVLQDEPTILRLSLYLDDELWIELRDVAEKLLRDGTSDLADLAARFTRFEQSSLSSNRVDPHFYSDHFELLIPRASWVSYTIRGALGDAVLVGEATLHNRTLWAAKELHEATRHERKEAGDRVDGDE
jgi:DNA polymerase III delta prime subunit